jgi:hypothetical protein
MLVLSLLPPVCVLNVLANFILKHLMLMLQNTWIGNNYTIISVH